MRIFCIMQPVATVSSITVIPCHSCHVISSFDAKPTSPSPAHTRRQAAATRAQMAVKLGQVRSEDTAAAAERQRRAVESNDEQPAASAHQPAISPNDPPSLLLRGLIKLRMSSLVGK